MGQSASVEHEIIWLALAMGTFGVALTTLAYTAVVLKRWRDRARSHADFTPPISILKPLKGIDDNLYWNLVSFVRQDYPRFELLLGVDDPHDPVVALVRQVQADFPRAPIRLVIRRSRVGLNPKVNNLQNLLDSSRHEHVLISDSNVMVSRDYLRRTVASLSDPKVGLVSNVVIGDGEQSLGSLLENVHLNTFILAGVCLGDWLGHPVVVGKSMLMRRADLMRLGGLHAVRDVLAEDYVLGKRIHDAGMTVVLSSHPVLTINQHWDVRRTLSRHGRWAKLRRFLQPAAFALEPVAFSGFWFALALTLSLVGDRSDAAQLALSGLLTKAALDVMLLAFVRDAQPTLLAWPLSVARDCLMVAVWLHACGSRTVRWRGNRLRLGRGTVLTPIASTHAADTTAIEAHAG